MYGSFTTTSGSNGMIQAPSLKLQASSTTLLYLGSYKQQATSIKLQAPSDKLPNQSNKRQASSRKQQAP